MYSLIIDFRYASRPFRYFRCQQPCDRSSPCRRRPPEPRCSEAAAPLGRWSRWCRPLQWGWLVVVFVLFQLSKGCQDVGDGFWDPVFARVEDNERDKDREEEDGRVRVSTSWAGCCGPESWSRPGWIHQTEQRRRTPEEDRELYHEGMISNKQNVIVMHIIVFNQPGPKWNPWSVLHSIY